MKTINLFYKILLCSLALSIICSCGSGPTYITVTKMGSGFYEPTNPNDVRILKTIPDRKYVELGTVIVSDVPPEVPYETANMYNELKTKSAVLGADAVILTDEGVVMRGSSNNQLRYWATGVAVKFE